MINGMFLKRSDCIICGQSNFKKVYNASFVENNIKKYLINYYNQANFNLIEKIIRNNFFSLNKCDDCNFLWQENVPDGTFLDDLYENFIDKNKSLKKSLEYSHTRKNSFFHEFNKIKKRFNKDVSKINILDFGCGWGDWALLAKSYGFNVSVLEVSKSRVAHLKSGNLNLIEDIDNIYYKNFFHYIRCEQVIEHVTHLDEIVIKMNNLIVKNGVLMVSVPDGKKLINLKEYKNIKIEKGPIQPLEHVNCFSNYSLKKIFYKHQFKKLSLFDIIYENLRLKSLTVRGAANILSQIYKQFFSTTIKFKKK